MRGKSGSFSSAGICNTYVDANGKKRTNGTKTLKQTQEYPAGYAGALFDNHVIAGPQDRMMDIKPSTDTALDNWPDAELNTAAQFLKLPQDRLVA